MAWLLLVLVPALLYSPFLDSPLVFDDRDFFTPELLAEFGGLGPLTTWPLRWIAYGSFGWTYALFGLEIPWLRAGNLAVHIAVGVALYHLLDMVLRIARDERDPGGAQGAAVIGALWFVAHPVAVYGVGYLVERSIAMAALFSLLSLIFLLHGISERNRWFLGCSALMYLLAVFSKEHAVALPGVAAVIVLLRKDDALRLKGELAALFAAYGLIAAFVSLRAKGLLGAPYEPSAMLYFERLAESGVRLEAEQAYILSILTQAGLFFEYLKLWLLPLPQWLSVDLRRAFATEIASPGALAAAAVFLAWPLGCWLLARRGAVAAWVALGLIFPWVLFLTELSVVRIQEPFVLYRSYLWMTGFALLPAFAAWALGRTTRRALAVPAILLLGLGTADRLTTFTSEFALWDDAARKHADLSLAGVWRAYANRGGMHGQARRWPEALADLDLALRLHPDYPHALLNRGNVHAALGKRELAIADFTRGLALARESGARDMAAYALARRGMLLGQSGDAQSGLRDFSDALHLAPRAGGVRYLFGRYLLESGHPSQASRQFRAACALGDGRGCAALQDMGGRF